jgi:Carboxypeptidase regulatory-like domain/TonB dependent receptor
MYTFTLIKLLLPGRTLGEKVMKLKTTLSWMLRISLAMIVGVMLFSPRPLHAQVDTGSIVGTISDPSGAVIGNATVTLTNEGTNASLSTAVGADGGFKFTPVRIGSYKVTVSSPGFQTTEQRDLAVNVGAAVLLNFVLKPGQVTETVQVEAGTPLLESQTSSVGQVVDSRSVNNLPLNGRNFTFLAQLGAGVNTPQSDTRGNAASGAFSANGLRAAQNNYLLDGIDNNSDTVDFLNGTNYVVLPPVDAIQEFKVQTTGFSAEFGRSGAAVLNATVKSGTNSFHGAGWEFLRNDVLDAPDYFESAGGIKKGELRLNQFGVAIGGPVIRNKVFFFGDYEGLRRRQGTIKTGTVPTLLERNSGFTDLSDLITNGSRADALGRQIPNGTILDPASTRPVTAGAADPVSGIVAVSTGFARDPFGTCPASTVTFTAAACGLNHLPLGRLDPNAVALLNLYPAPTNGSLLSNFATSPALNEHRNAFDSRLDINFSDKNQLFYRFSLVDDPQFIPGIFGGVADGGAFQEGDQTAIAEQSALGFTHVFSPSLINVARAGLNYLHTTRVSPSANDLSDIPNKFGIKGVPQLHENGGLPELDINGLNTLGTNGFLPSDEVTSTFQFTDDLTKIYRKHTFKMGVEFQHVKFSTLQPPWSRGDFQFRGAFVDVPGLNPQNTGRAQLLLTPVAATPGVGTVNFAGGPDFIQSSNISLSDNGKNYYGVYFNDDWRMTPKLTLNLGLRWDFFGLVYDHKGKQANFVPDGSATGSPVFLIPPGPNSGNLSASFLADTALDGITVLTTDKFGKGLGNSQKTNFAPRIGFAYQVTPKLVARGGFGIFYNGFENRGYFPNLGENYPFQFQFAFQSASNAANSVQPVIYTDPSGAPCSTAGPNGSGNLETGLSCTSFDPALVNANGLNLRGIQFNYITPYSMGGNFTLQYALTPSLSIQAAYVTTQARHLEVFPGSNNVSEILPSSLAPGDNISNHIPFPHFARGSTQATTNGNSKYNSLQVTVEKRFAMGLSFLGTYTWSKSLTDAVDLLNGDNTGYRAPAVPGFGIEKDYGLAPSDIRNVFHFSGNYELPFGKSKRYMSDAGGVANALVGGWSVNWSAALQGGQPFTIGCPTGTTNGTNCNALLVPGISPTSGPHNVTQFWNPAAFTQPCVLGVDPANPTGPPIPIPNSPAGCVPLSGIGALGGGPTQVAGPSFKRLDLSAFKDFRLSERFRLQFRAEIFNILNHPNFNAPGFGGNGVVSVPGSLNFAPNSDGTFGSGSFGRIGSTRDAPYDPRQIQFALKLYF